MAKKQSSSILCCKCGNEDKPTAYYISKSILYQHLGRLPICKPCIEELFNNIFIKKYNDKKVALYEMCRRLDMPFHNTVFEGSPIEDNQQLVSRYFTVINSLRKQNGYADDFDSGEKLEPIHTMEAEEFSDEINLDDFEVDNNTIRFFGRGFEKEDYYFLINEYEDWVTRYECDSKAMEDIIKQICLTNLDIRNRRINGEKVDAQLKTLQDLLGSANLKPVQETGANATEQATFGTLLKKWENEKPVPEPLEEWEKSNWIKKYVSVWFLGHLSRMLGIQNPNSEMYDEEINKYSVELPSEEDLEEGDTYGES